MIWQLLSDNHEVVTALATIFIAISSLWVALRSLSFAEKQREHNELSLAPHLDFTETDRRVKPEDCHAIHLRNFGTGPARNISYVCRLDSETFSDPNEFVVGFKKMFADHFMLKYGATKVEASQDWIGRYFTPALFPGQSERILWLKTPDEGVQYPTTDQNKCDIVEAFHDLLERIDICVYYTSPHNKSFTRTLSDSRSGSFHNA